MNFALSGLADADRVEIGMLEGIDYSEKLSAAYVSPYGLGLEFHHTPFYYLTSEMSDIEGQIVEGWPMGVTINYRISRNWLTWLGFEGTAGAFRLEKSCEATTYQQAKIENMELPPTSISYVKERTYIAGIFGLGYVCNVNRNFNVTQGGDVKLVSTAADEFPSLHNFDPPHGS